MATTETIRDNLAFIGEFGVHSRGTHVGTRIALYSYVTDTPVDVDAIMAGRSYRSVELNEKGRVEAAFSPLTKCFEWLRENGYKRDPSWNRRSWSGSFIPYCSEETDEEGIPLRTAFISSWSRVYARTRGQASSGITFDGRPGRNR